MEGLIRFLEEKAEKGETIEVAYGGGSSPGRVRKLVIVACDEKYIKARELGLLRVPPKTYKIAKIIWARDKAG